MPEAITDEQQERRHEWTEPGNTAHVTVEQATRRVEVGKSVRDDPRQQDGDPFGVDRKRILGEQVVIEDETRDREVREGLHFVKAKLEHLQRSVR